MGFDAKYNCGVGVRPEAVPQVLVDAGGGRNPFLPTFVPVGCPRPPRKLDPNAASTCGRRTPSCADVIIPGPAALVPLQSAAGGWPAGLYYKSYSPAAGFSRQITTTLMVIATAPHYMMDTRIQYPRPQSTTPVWPTCSSGERPHSCADRGQLVGPPENNKTNPIFPPADRHKLLHGIPFT